MTLWLTPYGIHGEVVASNLTWASFGAWSWSWRDWWERYWTDHPERRPASNQEKSLDNPEEE